ncbi:uncharacterized protein [Acropora muricata]|uniref:uncharacterized protein isoform X1 n=1 Tax=Acropora muricata TaxID=159855 RepID=UPI0034E3A25D
MWTTWTQDNRFSFFFSYYLQTVDINLIPASIQNILWASSLGKIDHIRILSIGLELACNGVLTFGERNGQARHALTRKARRTFRGDYDGGNGGPCPVVSMSKGCRISTDCRTITCNTNLTRSQETIQLKVNKCDNAVSVTTSMTVRGPGMSWSHTYTSDDIIKVPNCTVSLVGFYSVGVGPSHRGSAIDLKVNYVFGEKTYKQNIYPWKRTAFINGDLSTSTSACGIFGWCYDLSSAAQAAVISGSLLFIVVLIILFTLVKCIVAMHPIC